MFAFSFILLLKIVDFGNKICTVCNKIENLTGFSKFTGSYLNIQSGVLHWLNRSLKSDFWIAITFLFLSNFDLAWFGKELHFRFASLQATIAITPFKKLPIRKHFDQITLQYKNSLLFVHVESNIVDFNSGSEQWRRMELFRMIQ